MLQRLAQRSGNLRLATGPIARIGFAASAASAEFCLGFLGGSVDSGFHLQVGLRWTHRISVFGFQDSEGFGAQGVSGFGGLGLG